MPVVLPEHLKTLGECRTPDEFKAKIGELLGPALAQYEVCSTDVLFATYIEPHVTAGGIYKADKTQQEILFQGVIGLIVGMGPLACKWDSRGFKWEGRIFQLGEWIVARFSDCWELHIDGVSCRLIDPENIRGVIKTPEIIRHRPVPRTSLVAGPMPLFGLPFEGTING